MAINPLTNVAPSGLWDGAPSSPGSRECGSQKAELRPIHGLLPKLLYEQFGILENPFGATPNPRYLYQSRTHAEAKSSLIVGLECGVGFQALIAPPGMGKTTILFDVVERFNKIARTAFLFQIHGDSCDFLRYLISELGGEAHDSDRTRMQDSVNRLLIRERRAGRQTIVIIDEAQNLSTSVLETIRLLSNFETPTEKMLRIILAGQTQLAQTLVRPEMAQLNQRISILTTLIPFSLEDTNNYIDHRLKIAGYQGPPLFTAAAMRLIWERSGGIPREINTLCFNALLLMRATEKKQADSDILSKVVADRDLNFSVFNSEIHANAMRDTQTADRRGSENVCSDPAATSNRIRKIAVSGAEAEPEEVTTRRNAFNRVDLVELGTLAAGVVSTSSNKDANQPVVAKTKKQADDMVRGGYVVNRPGVATCHKTDVVMFGDAPASGLPSCETSALMRLNLAEQQLMAIAPLGARDRFVQELVAWFALCGGGWTGTAAELLKAIKARVGIGDDLWTDHLSALYTHIESQWQTFRSLGVNVSVHDSCPRMVSLRSCQAENPQETNEVQISNFPPGVRQPKSKPRQPGQSRAE
jgi:general secretion pathway protein A